jgi:hypothetical protein
LRAIFAKQSPTLSTADRNAEIASSQKTLLAMTPERLPFIFPEGVRRVGGGRQSRLPPTPSKMWGKFEKFALRPLFSSVVAGARAHEQLLP